MSPAIADKPIFQPPIPFTTLFQLNSKKTQTNPYFSLYYQRHYRNHPADFLATLQFAPSMKFLLWVIII